MARSLLSLRAVGPSLGGVMRPRHKMTMGLVVTLAACARVGAPAPAPTAAPQERAAAMTSRALSGVATFGGQRLRVTVVMETDEAGRGTAHLEIPDLSLTADGQAAWKGATLELDLRYDGGCPGELRIRADRVADGDRLEGTLNAKDCTGEESGRVVLEGVARPSGGTAVPRRVESRPRGV